jgi:surfeit locus 1 family protein
MRLMVLWLAAVLSIGCTARLGVWQLHRAQEKHRAAQILAERQHLSPWQNTNWPCARGEQAHDAAGRETAEASSLSPYDELPVQRPAMLRGRWMTDKTVLLDNRPMDGRSGFIVVTPLQLSSGESTCPRGIVLEERGWIPRDPQERLRIAPVQTTEQEVVVRGKVVARLSQSYQLGHEDDPAHQIAPLVRQNADGHFWLTWLGSAPLAGALQETQAAEPVDEPRLVRNWIEPGFGEDRHKAYALQWLVMSGVLACLTIWFLIVRPLRSRAG